MNILVSVIYLVFFSSVIALPEGGDVSSLAFNTQMQKGGNIVSIVYQSDEAETDNLLLSKEVIRKRLEHLGKLDAKVTIDDKNKLLTIEVPDIEKENTDGFAQDLVRTANIQFKGADGKVILEGKDIISAESKRMQTNTISSGWVVSLKFNPEGAKKFAEATGRISKLSDGKNYISIYLDEKLISSPIVHEKIDAGSAFIEGADFTEQSAKEFAALIRSGTLPIKLKVKEIR